MNSTLSLIKTKQLHAQILKSQPQKSLSLYKSIITFYSQNGLFTYSISSFIHLRSLNHYPDHNIFPSILKSCTHLRNLSLGESVHGSVIRFGLDSDLYACNALMNMYSKIQSFGYKVFDKSQNVNDFNLIDVNNSNVIGSGKRACDSSNAIINMDSKIQSFGEKVFDKSRNVSDFDLVGVDNCNVIDSGKWVCDSSNAVMNMDSKIQSFGVKEFEKSRKSSSFDLVGVDNSNVVDSGKRVCGDSSRSRNVGSESVKKVFEMMTKRDRVSWNTVIAGFAQSGMFDEALEMVRELGKSDLRLDSFTLSSVLPIFAEFVDVLKGKEIHGYAIKHGLDDDVFTGSGLIDMYANCMRVGDSYRVFELLSYKDSVSWNALIAGCVQNGMFDEGLSLFRKMLLDNFAPRPVSFSSIIPACAHLAMINLGKELHGYIIRRKLDDNVFIASSLVDMYARFGNITVARCIFNSMEDHDIVTYTAMIMGCALHGHAHEAVSLFENMEVEGIKPNAVAFVAVLTACSHANLVDEGWGYFNCMIDTYAITPSMEHYAAMADLLGRAGKLEEAYEFISNIDIPEVVSVWSTLLAACRVHKNINLAQRVAEKIVSLDPENTGAYVTLSNTYSASKMWKGAALLRMRMRDKGMKKNVAYSWVEINRKVHAFASGDKSHPCYDRINEALRTLLEVMEKEGYIRNTNEVIKNVDD